jgi:hypothetical protein
MVPEKPDLTCEEAESRFSSRMEKDLTDSEHTALENHFQGCPKCRTGYEQFCRALEALHAFKAQPLPDALAAATVEAARRQDRGPHRTWPLRLAWNVATAAAAVAIYAVMCQPEPVTIRVPLERRVVVEREVTVPMPVEVPVFEPVTVTIENGAIERVHAGSVVPAASGECVVFHAGDRIRILPGDAPQAAVPAVLIIDIDSRLLAGAVRQTGDSIFQAAARMLEAASIMAASGRDQPGRPAPVECPAPAPLLALVWEPGGTLVLETSGPDHEVVPQLIAMLNDDSSQVRAVARGGLKSIQERLYRDHGISAPRARSPAPEKNSGWTVLTDMFQPEEEPAPPPAVPVSEIWGKWWHANREFVACLALGHARL